MPEKLRTLNKKKGTKKHGFLTRSKSHSGKNVIKRRRLKGRKRI